VLVNEETDEILAVIPKVVTVEESVLLDGRVETRHRRDFKVGRMATARHARRPRRGVLRVAGR